MDTADLDYTLVPVGPWHQVGDLVGGADHTLTTGDWIPTIGASNGGTNLAMTGGVGLTDAAAGRRSFTKSARTPTHIRNALLRIGSIRSARNGAKSLSRAFYTGRDDDGTGFFGFDRGTYGI